MYGRHGTDQFTYGLMGVFLVLAIINNFLRGFAYLIVLLLSLAVLAYACYRMFSRQNEKRWAENQKFLTAMQPIAQWWQKFRRWLGDRKVYRYYRCPKCKATLRVPRGRGKIRITCPVCKEEFVKKA